MSKFNHPVTIPEDDDKQSRLQLLDLLGQWRQVAQPNILSTLRLGAQYNGQDDCPFAGHLVAKSTCPPLCSHIEWPCPRPQHVVPGAVHTGLELAIVRPIVTGRRNAQVYLATFTPDADATVTVKIYQASLMPAVDPEDLHVNEPKEEWERALQPYRTECWAYERMRDLQGVVVPYIHGFFRVCKISSLYDSSYALCTGRASQR